MINTFEYQKKLLIYLAFNYDFFKLLKTIIL